MFQTLDDRRRREHTRSERVVRWISSIILSVIVLGSVYLGTMLMQ
jgi:hypothetical protein